MTARAWDKLKSFLETGDQPTETQFSDFIDSIKNIGTQRPVIDKDTLTPPGSPSEGDRYIINGTGTGDWSSQDRNIAEWDGTQWVFDVKFDGMSVFVEDEDVLYFYNNSIWSGDLTIAGNINVSGIFDSTKWGSNWDTIDTGSYGTWSVDESSKDLHHGLNFYNDNSNFKFKVTGVFAIKQVKADTGVIIDSISSVTGTADANITFNEIRRVDADGNISYNGATIESDLFANYNFVFKNDSCVMNSTVDDNIFSCGNCWRIAAGTFNFMDGSKGATVVLTSNGTITEYNIPSSVSDGFTIATYETRKVDTAGNVAYNGATLFGSLDTGISYTFWDRSCRMISDTGSTWICNNVYLETGGVFKSMENTGLTCTYSRILTASYIIRKSDAVVTAIGQTMTMDQVITPS